MAGSITREGSWKEHETDDPPSFKVNGSIGTIEDVYHHMSTHNRRANAIPRYPEKKFRDHLTESEQQKSKALMNISRMQTRLI